MVPTTRYRQVAKRAIAITRRPLHPVKGFWRLDWRNPFTKGCLHEWESLDQNHIGCKTCKGRKIFVKDHVRGDASLGVITHEYAVHHPTEKETT